MDPTMKMIATSQNEFYSSYVNHSTNVNENDTNLKNIQITLANQHVWEQFNEHVNEMIVTKNGRRIFPPISINIESACLSISEYYSFGVDVVQVGDHRYKYVPDEGGWQALNLSAGSHEEGVKNDIHWSIESPAKLEHWEKTSISFSKLKLTNSLRRKYGLISVISMRKYCLRVHVIKHSTQSPLVSYRKVILPITEFIAVTAYQNPKIVQLKIENNPFARGFKKIIERKKPNFESKKRTRSCNGDSESENSFQEISITKNSPKRVHIEKSQSSPYPFHIQNILPQQNMSWNFLSPFFLQNMQYFMNLLQQQFFYHNSIQNDGGGNSENSTVTSCGLKNSNCQMNESNENPACDDSSKSNQSDNCIKKEDYGEDTENDLFLKFK